MLVTAKWTIEDYHRIIASGALDDKAVELIFGDIVEMIPEGESHAFRSDEAGEYLIRLLDQKAKVRQAKPITIPDSNSEPEPDIAIVQRLGRDYLNHHPYPDNIYWVIEFSGSSLNQDLEVMTRLYAKAGISEYWIVDLKTLQLIVMRSPMGDHYQTQKIRTEGTITPLSLPDISIDIARLLNR